MREGWEIKRVKEICDKASSNIAQKEIVGKTGDYPVYGASGYVQNIDFFHRDKPYIGVVKDGSGVGRVNTYPAKTSLLGTLQYIIPKDGYLLGYVAYLLKSLNLSKFATGAAIPHIYFKEYGECKVPVPPVQEQEKIVAELDCLTGIIEKKKQQLKELDNLAQSIFYDMFGDPITNEKGWEIKKIAEVSCRLFAGGDVPKSSFSSYYSKEYPIPIFSNGLENDGLYGYTSKAREDRECITFAGRGVNIGTPILRNTPFFPIIRLNVVVPDVSQIMPVFMLYYFRIAKITGNGGAIPQLTIPMLSIQPLFIPPIDLQNTFAQKIEAIEKQKELIKKSIQETETLFNSRMDYWFN